MQPFLHMALLNSYDTKTSNLSLLVTWRQNILSWFRAKIAGFKMVALGFV